MKSRVYTISTLFLTHNWKQKTRFWQIYIIYYYNYIILQKFPSLASLIISLPNIQLLSLENNPQLPKSFKSDSQRIKQNKPNTALSSTEIWALRFTTTPSPRFHKNETEFPKQNYKSSHRYGKNEASDHQIRYLGRASTWIAENDLVEAIDAFANINVRRSQRSRGRSWSWSWRENLFATHNSNSNNTL